MGKKNIQIMFKKSANRLMIFSDCTVKDTAASNAKNRCGDICKAVGGNQFASRDSFFCMFEYIARKGTVIIVEHAVAS